MKEYNNEMSFIQRVVYSMIRNGGDNVFLPYGMTINGTNIVLYGNDDFPLKGETCAYYDVQNNSININIEDEFFNKDKE